MTVEAPAPAKSAGRAERRPKRETPSLTVILVKIIGLGVLDAVVLYAAFILIADSRWVVAVVAIIGALLINYIYLSPRVLAGKYLAPGLTFLAIFQIFVIFYSAYIGFTNYGDGHNGAKQDAVDSIQTNSLTRVPDSATYPVTVVRRDGNLGLLVTEPDGKVGVAESGQPLETVTDATVEGGKAVSLPGWDSLNLGDLIAVQDQVSKLSVPLSSDLSQGAISTADGNSGYLFLPKLTYNEKADSFTDTATGTVYTDNGKGTFTSSTGDALTPGWTVGIGFSNFTSAFSDPAIRGPVLGVVVWTFVFAALSTFLCFAVGLFLAITFNHPTMRGKKIYRIVMILPYAFPGFLSSLVWAGLLNQEFGFVNSVLLGGAQLPWLSDPTLAKVSVLLVNTWAGFPYMFLVSTGALQSIPEEVTEAATVDGAKPWAIFRLIKLPLLLVTMAPILIATFAYNFNNFNTVYLLTQGGPADINAPINVGGTDILITLVYKIAFQGLNGRDYGLASAFSILIFIVISIISIIAFRRTKSLEDVN